MFSLVSRSISLRNICPHRRLHLSTIYSNQITNKTKPNIAGTNEKTKPSGYDQLYNLFDKEIKQGGVVPIFKRSLLHANHIAVEDGTGEYTHRQILDASTNLTAEILAHTSGNKNNLN